MKQPLQNTIIAAVLLPLLPAGVAALMWFRAIARERTGDLERARRESRRGGVWLTAASLGLVCLLLSRTPWAVTGWSVTVLSLSGAAAVLGGLSGKPRPTGPIALLLFACGWGLLVYRAFLLLRL